MSWVSSTFGDNNDTAIFKRPRPKPKAKGNKIYCQTPSKKLCVNLWVDEYVPSLDDLAVHKKKVEEVQNWLTECQHKVKERRLLLLTGPPGSAKSTCIHALSKAMNFNLKHWVNSNSLKQDYSKENYMSYSDRLEERGLYTSQSERFSDFLFRSSKYRNVCVDEEETSSIILVEELPHVFTLNPLEFQLLLRKYSSRCSTPIVFVMSESHNNSSQVKAWFPSELQEELVVTNIVFNPVSASLMLSALTRILELCHSGVSPLFDAAASSKKQFLQRVAEGSGGDVRSAVNSLQFAMMNGESVMSEERGGRDDCGKRKKRKKGEGGKGKKDDDSESLQSILGCKDSSLVLFRALGKVLYCKREPPSSPPSEPSLPRHLRNHIRTPLLETPEDVFERSHTDPSTFSLFLHHNCVPFFDDVGAYAAALRYLADADVLGAVWDPSSQLSQYASSVSIRGLMHSLKGGESEKGEEKREVRAPPRQHTFRALTRPSFYNVLHTGRERSLSLKRVLRSSLFRLSLGEDFFTVFVPLVPKVTCAGSSHTTEVDRFLGEVGLLYPLSTTSSGTITSGSPLVTKDVGHHPTTSLSSGIENTLEQEGDEESEDFRIEEFED